MHWHVLVACPDVEIYTLVLPCSPPSLLVFSSFIGDATPCIYDAYMLQLRGLAKA